MPEKRSERMERTVMVGGKPYNIRASAWALVIYKAQFGREYTEDAASINNDEEAYIVGCRLLWAMARAAKSKLPSPDDWIAMFKGKEIVKALKTSQQLFAFSMGEDRGGKGEEFSSETLIASAAICGMRSEELNSLPLGMVIDTMEEYAEMRFGDGSEYVSAAEFFGE